MSILIQMTVTFLLSYVAYKFITKRRILKNSLPNKVVLITGASSGIGEALAHVFYIAGCRLILTARRKDELERVRKDLLQNYSTKVTHPPVVMILDVTDLKGIKQKAEQALNIHGHIDILVNNSGITHFGDVISTSYEDDLKVMTTNYFGAVELTRALLPSMVERRKGRIVCISSVLGKFSVPFVAQYCASKFAMQSFCDSLRAEVHNKNIKVTLISPGFVATSLVKNSTVEIPHEVHEYLANGFSALVVAFDALRAVLNDEKDVVIAEPKHHLIIWFQFLFPSLFRWILALQARQKFQKS